jgi:hypothetical protein
VGSGFFTKQWTSVTIPVKVCGLLATARCPQDESPNDKMIKSRLEKNNLIFEFFFMVYPPLFYNYYRK